MFSCQIYHYKVDKFFQKSCNNVFKNYVIPEGGEGGYVKRLCWIISGGGGGLEDPQNGLRNC